MAEETIQQHKEGLLLRLRLLRELTRVRPSGAVLAERLAASRGSGQALCQSLLAEGLIERRGDRYRASAEVDEILQHYDERDRRPWLPALTLMLAAALALLVYMQWGSLQTRVAASLTAPRASSAAAKEPSQPVQAAPQPLMTYYIVDSTEQADHLGSLLQDLALYLGSPDSAKPKYIIGVAGSPDEAARFHRFMDESNDLTAEGQPAFRVVDLRPSAAFSHRFVYYLVASRQQADQVEAQLTAEEERLPVPWPALDYAVVVVHTAEEEMRLRLGVDVDEHAALDGARSGSEFVDLRPGAAKQIADETPVFFYLVDSAEQADDLASGRDEISVGTPPADGVIVVRSGSPEEMEAAVSAVPPAWVVDIAGSDYAARQTGGLVTGESASRRERNQSGLRLIDLRRTPSLQQSTEGGERG